MSDHRRARPHARKATHTYTTSRGRQPPCSSRRAITRQIKTILEQTPEGFDTQANAAIQAIGAEHLREIRTLMSTPTAPDRLHGALIAVLIYDLVETGQEGV